MMRVLVTGAAGLLGSEMLRAVAEKGFMGSALDRFAFLGSTASKRAAMLSGFDVVVHAAANTNVEQCEMEPERCYYDNCFLTEQLFQHARGNGVRFVFISSTGVYGRHKTEPYHEYDMVSPTTQHHHSKYVSEQAVLTCATTLVARVGWLFGGSFENKKNFVVNRLNEVRAMKGAISANNTQIGTPTYARDCASALLRLIEDGCSGVYNIVNDGRASRFDYVRRIVELSGAPFEVLPSDASIFKRKADVSENEAAISYRMKFEGRQRMRPWQDALAEYMQESGLLGCLTECF